jgi:hypothetical protein
VGDIYSGVSDQSPRDAGQAPTATGKDNDFVEDYTTQVIEFLKSRFPGHEVFQPLSTWQDNTREDLGVKTGNEIKAKGTSRIGDFVSAEGAFKRIDVANFTLWVTEPHLKFTFRFKSDTHGEKWMWPGGLFAENVWDSVHPEGTITGVLRMIPTKNAVLRLEISVDPGNADAPNDFVKNRVVPLHLGKLDALLEEFTAKDIDS